MGLVTKATILFSSTTFIGYLGLRHLRKSIKEVPLPPASILQHYFHQAKNSNPNDGHFADAFQAQIPSNVAENVHHKGDKRLNVDSCVRSFYSSWIFKIEKTIMKFILRQPEPDLSSFEIGKSIYLWKVESRNDEEILLLWETGSFKGSTWFYFSQERSVIMFGSSIQTPKNSNKRNQISSIPSEYNIHNTSTYNNGESKNNEFSSNPGEIKVENLVEKTKNSVENIIWSVVLSFHRTYSLIILNGVVRKIIKQTG